ncbi:MAG TPA: putative DNA-binding domain-containing protein [Tahibacter sp.]|nr:putative DNA-binding domain-containing protein [Tahibacter sp.]
MSRPADASLDALQRHFAACIRAPESTDLPPGVAPGRMAVYRELFFNNVEGLLSANFPVIRSLRDDDAWLDLARGFLREHRAQTPLFPEFAREFLRYLERRQGEDRGDPPFLLELAHYEWAELALSLDENEIGDVAHDPAGDPVAGVPVVSPLAWPLGYRFPVHRIRPDFQPDAAPAEPTLLLLVRDRADDVGFMEINAITAMLVERLQANAQSSGLYVLDALLDEVAPGNAAALRDGGIAMLRELKRRDAILGTAAI